MQQSKKRKVFVVIFVLLLFSRPLPATSTPVPLQEWPREALKPQISPIEAQLSSSLRLHSAIGLRVLLNRVGQGSMRNFQSGLLVLSPLSLTGLTDMREGYWRKQVFDALQIKLDYKKSTQGLVLSNFKAVQNQELHVFSYL